MKDRVVVAAIVSCAALVALLSGLGCSPRESNARQLHVFAQTPPIYPSAYDINKGEGYVKYKVDLPYKSMAVLGFYERELRKEGWKPWTFGRYIVGSNGTLHDNYRGREWQTFVDLRGVEGDLVDQDALVDQLLAAWGKQSNDRRLILVLRERARPISEPESAAEHPKVVQHVTLSLTRLAPGAREILEKDRVSSARKEDF